LRLQKVYRLLVEKTFRFAAGKLYNLFLEFDFYLINCFFLFIGLVKKTFSFAAGKLYNLFLEFLFYLINCFFLFIGLVKKTESFAAGKLYNLFLEFLFYLINCFFSKMVKKTSKSLNTIIVKKTISFRQVPYCYIMLV